MCEFQESPDLSSASLLDLPAASPYDKSSYWQEHFKSWENSGLSQAEYCRRHNLNYSVFHYWKRKLRRPSQPSITPESETINFVEVGSSLPFSSGLSLRTAPGDFFRLWIGGVCVEVGTKFDPQSLSQLLRCLRGL